MFSLAQRVAFLRPMIPNPSVVGIYDAEAAIGRLKCEADLIATATKFRLDNVAKFYAEHDNQNLRLREDIPNWSPPFDVFWMEWNQPQNWNMGGGEWEANDSREVAGCFVVAMNVHDLGSKLDIAKIVCGSAGVDPKFAPQFADRVRTDARWILATDMWSTSPTKPLYNAPFWPGLTACTFVSGDGQWLDTLRLGVGWPAGADWLDPVQRSHDTSLRVVGLGLSFLHCKNVSCSEIANTGRARSKKLTAIPDVVYKVLDIEPMRARLRSEGDIDRNGTARAMHICRGHFASYSEEGPLFGKHVGSFWIPSHVRGKENNGVVIKDYKL